MTRIDEQIEPGVFDRLVRDEQVSLLRFAYLLCGDHHQAEDAVAEALARTWSRWHRGVIDEPKAYIRRSIVNELRGRARRSVVRQRYEGRRRPAPTVRSIAEDAVERDAMHEALLGLPIRQRAALVLRFYEDRSERATAELLGVSAGTIKTHVHRGLAQLRILLEEDT